MTVPVRDAATVILLRDGADGVEAWLLTRVSQMVFAAGMTVFPGGRVEVSDGETPVADEAVTQVARLFGCDQATARAFVGAAARETFEETAVLLTVPPAVLPDSVAAVESGELAFADLLRANGLLVDSAALVQWSRWVTPEGEPRRYDTRFFVAALPTGAEAADVTSESSVASWVRPVDALADMERGERVLLPPTLMTLISLRDYATVADVIANAPTEPIEAIRPTLHLEGDRVEVELPSGKVMRIR